MIITNTIFRHCLKMCQRAHICTGQILRFEVRKGKSLFQSCCCFCCCFCSSSNSIIDSMMPLTRPSPTPEITSQAIEKAAMSDDEATISSSASRSLFSIGDIVGPVILSDFNVHSLLRTDSIGAFHVFKVQEGKANFSYYSLKCLKRKSSQAEMQSESELLRREARLLECLRHPNIVTARGLPSQSPYGYFLAYELIEETLEDRLNSWTNSSAPRRMSIRKPNSWSRSQRGDSFDERIQQSMIGICSALMYLHSRQIVHPLRPDCIGFDAEGTVKIFDFGLYEEMSPSRMRYMSPEYIRSRKVSFASDVYSFGVLLWQVATLREPFAFIMEEKTRIPLILQRLVNKNWRPDTKSIPNDKIRRIIKDCWHSNPDARPTITQISFTLSEWLPKTSRTEDDKE
jgi:serine/threonine protein kinase